MRLGLRGSVALPKHADRYTDSNNAFGGCGLNRRTDALVRPNGF